jgi:hypothetical protein
VCPGELETISLGVPVVITSFTTGYTDDYANYTDQGGPGVDCGGSGIGSPDRVFMLFPTEAGMLTVTLPNLGAVGGGFDGVLAAWTGVCEPTNPMSAAFLGCSDGPNGPETETLTFQVAANVVYFVVVDGYASFSYGNFELTAELN